MAKLLPIFLLVVGTFNGLFCEQRFRKRPENATVVEGETIVLKCEIEQQQGPTQWAKDGFALGYERSLPGYSRYQMIGEPSLGQHHLQIINTSGSDQGRFQCQVAPHAGQPAIWAAAHLTVLVKPKNVRLAVEKSVAMATQKKAAGSVQSRDSNSTNVLAMSDERLTLSCDVTGSRPPSEVVWYENGVILTSAGNNSSVQVVNDTSDTNISRSLLRIVAQPALDGSVFTCQAKHASIMSADSSKYSRTAVLKVLYAPGAPVILPETSQQTIYHRLGDSVQLVCRSLGGQPPAELVWFRNGRRLDNQQYRLLQPPGRGDASNVSLGGGSSNASGDVRRPVMGAEAMITVLIEQDTSESEFLCQSSSPVQPQPREVTRTLLVAYGPQDVLVSGPSLIRRDELLPLVCNVTGSNPAPEVEWSVDKRRIETTTMESGTMVSQQYANFSYIVSASLPVLDVTSADLIVQCKATNPQTGESQTSSMHVQLLFAPQFVDIDGGDTVNATENSALQVNMTAVGNPPDLQYSWSRSGGGQVPQAAGPVLVFNSVARSDAGVYTVNASNTEGWSVTQVRLDVQYSPKIELAPDRQSVVEAESLTLECRIDSNPFAPEMIEWKDNHGRLFDLNNNNNSGKVKVTVNTDDRVSRLTLVNVSRDQMGLYTCSVNNGVGTANKTTQLDVEYIDIESKSDQPDKLAIKPGAAGWVQCRVRSSEKPQIIWFHNDHQMKSGNRFTVTLKKVDSDKWLSELRLINVKQSDYGKLECRAVTRLTTLYRSVGLQNVAAPEAPHHLTGTNITDTTALVSWRAAFSGGLPQVFRVRYTSFDTRSSLQISNQKETGNLTTVLLKDLRAGVSYNVSVEAVNALGSTRSDQILSFKTKGVAGTSSSLAASSASSGAADSAGLLLFPEGRVSWLLVTVICSVGGVLLLSNLALVLFVIRRKRHKSPTTTEQLSPSEASTKSETVQTYVNESSSVSMKSDTYPSDVSPEHYTVEITPDNLGLYAGQRDDCVNIAPHTTDDCSNYAATISRYSPAYTSAPNLNRRRLPDTTGPSSSLFPPRAPCFRDPSRQDLLTPDLLSSGTYSTGLQERDHQPQRMATDTDQLTGGSGTLLARANHVYVDRLSDDSCDVDSSGAVGVTRSGGNTDSFSQSPDSMGCTLSGSGGGAGLEDVSFPSAATMPAFSGYRSGSHYPDPGAASDAGIYSSYADYTEYSGNPLSQHPPAMLPGTQSNNLHYFPRRTYIDTEGPILQQHLIQQRQLEHVQHVSDHFPQSSQQPLSMPGHTSYDRPQPGLEVTSTLDPMQCCHSTHNTESRPIGQMNYHSTLANTGELLQPTPAALTTATVGYGQSDDFEHRGHLV